MLSAHRHELDDPHHQSTEMMATIPSSIQSSSQATATKMHRPQDNPTTLPSSQSQMAVARMENQPTQKPKTNANEKQQMNNTQQNGANPLDNQPDLTGYLRPQTSTSQESTTFSPLTCVLLIILGLIFFRWIKKRRKLIVDFSKKHMPPLPSNICNYKRRQNHSETTPNQEQTDANEQPHQVHLVDDETSKQRAKSQQDGCEITKTNEGYLQSVKSSMVEVAKSTEAKVRLLKERGRKFIDEEAAELRAKHQQSTGEGHFGSRIISYLVSILPEPKSDSEASRKRQKTVELDSIGDDDKAFESMKHDFLKCQSQVDNSLRPLAASIDANSLSGCSNSLLSPSPVLRANTQPVMMCDCNLRASTRVSGAMCNQRPCAPTGGMGPEIRSRSQGHSPNHHLNSFPITRPCCSVSPSAFPHQCSGDPQPVGHQPRMVDYSLTHCTHNQPYQQQQQQVQQFTCKPLCPCEQQRQSRFRMMDTLGQQQQQQPQSISDTKRSPMSIFIQQPSMATPPPPSPLSDSNRSSAEKTSPGLPEKVSPKSARRSIVKQSGARQQQQHRPRPSVCRFPLQHRASIASDGCWSIASQSSHCNKLDLNSQCCQFSDEQSTVSSSHRPSDASLYGYSASYSNSYGCGQQSGNLSSSGGSSSGIFVSGSACTNTPTSAMPYADFGGCFNNPLILPQTGCNFPINNNTASFFDYPYQQHHVYNNYHSINSNANRMDDLCHLSSNRKFSLPVQLESNAAERLSPPPKETPLFDRNQLNQAKSRKISSRINRYRSANERRNSQAITRQSSFWLEDTSIDSNPSLSGSTNLPQSSQMSQDIADSIETSLAATGGEPFPAPSDQSAPQRPSISSIVMSGDSIDSVRANFALASQAEAPTESQPAAQDQLASPDQPVEKTELPNAESPTSSPSSSKASTASSSNDSSPSPDFGRSTERAKLLNSASMERQCRDLWKLRATLHQDHRFGDTWTTYHQRLNRRNDSGYKSIENQLSSSLEGNILLPLANSPTPTAMDQPQEPTQGGQSSTVDSALLARPASGCSGAPTKCEPVQEAKQEEDEIVETTQWEEEEEEEEDKSDAKTQD